MSASIFRLTLVLTVFCLSAICACTDNSSSDSSNLPDGDGDADLEEGNENEGEETASDECDFSGVICDGNDVTSCVDGTLERVSCDDGMYCNYGSCFEYSVAFPDDAGFHDERSEWWYYTGHLKSGGQSWGFEVTIFQYDLQATMGLSGYGYMCHVAVTDNLAGEHYHTDRFAMSPKTWTAAPTVLEIEDCLFELDGTGNDHVVGVIPEGKEKDGKISPWKIDLTFEPQKRPTLHGGDGIIPMGDYGGTSWYYSYTRLSTGGTLTTPDGDYAVEGQAWMDHQWGQFDISEFKGWDWWSMQFEDGFEIMLFQFTNWDGNLATQAGTLIDPDGNITELEGIEDFSITSQRSWESSHTDGVYPLDWNIVIPKMDWKLEVRTHIDDQEMYNAAQNYWEGNTTITGTRSGQPVSGVGYTELTGYATDFLDPK